MHLFDLAPELVQHVFSEIVLSRDIPRGMRLRRVSRQFKGCVDEAIFRLRRFTPLSAAPYFALDFRPSHGPLRAYYSRDWINYVHSYLTYQALRERSTTSALGCVRRAAQTICDEVTGDTGSEAIATCLRSLVRLAASKHAHSLFQTPPGVLRHNCSELGFKFDNFVAAVHLGHEAYVERLIAEGILFYDKTRAMPHVGSAVFGDAFHAATMQGNVGMIKLLLSYIPEYKDEGILPRGLQFTILRDASSYGQRAAFDFALEVVPFTLRLSETRPSIAHFQAIVTTVFTMPWPDCYERMVAQLESPAVPKSKTELSRPYRLKKPIARLCHSAASGNVEMVRYLLSKGVAPNSSPEDRGPFSHLKPLLAAIDNCHDDTIVRILLDGGADPNWYPAGNTALMAAAWRGNVAVVRLLLAHGANIDEGSPPPIVLAVFQENVQVFHLLREHGARLDTPESGAWAMALAKSDGLCSMVDLLACEGVGEDVILHRVASRDEIYRRQLWPIWART